MDIIKEGKIDATLFPIIRGEAISVRMAHIQYLLELLEAGKVEQVQGLLKNLLDGNANCSF